MKRESYSKRAGTNTLIARKTRWNWVRFFRHDSPWRLTYNDYNETASDIKIIPHDRKQRRHWSALVQCFAQNLVISVVFLVPSSYKRHDPLGTHCMAKVMSKMSIYRISSSCSIFSLFFLLPSLFPREYSSRKCVIRGLGSLSPKLLHYIPTEPLLSIVSTTCKRQVSVDDTSIYCMGMFMNSVKLVLCSNLTCQCYGKLQSKKSNYFRKEACDNLKSPYLIWLQFYASLNSVPVKLTDGESKFSKWVILIRLKLYLCNFAFWIQHILKRESITIDWFLGYLKKLFSRTYVT